MAVLKRIFTIEAFAESLKYVERLQAHQEHKGIEQSRLQAGNTNQSMNDLFMSKVIEDMYRV